MDGSDVSAANERDHTHRQQQRDYGRLGETAVQGRVRRLKFAFKKDPPPPTQHIHSAIELADLTRGGGMLPSSMMS